MGQVAKIDQFSAVPKKVLCFHLAFVPVFFVREILNICCFLKKIDANQRAIFTSLFETNFQSLRGLFCGYILHLVIRNKYLVLLNSRTPSSCVQFLYSSRKTNRLNSWLTKKSFSLLKYQDRYVPFGLFQFLLLFGRFGNICSKFMPLILKNFLLQKVRDTFHRSSCKIWQTMVAKVLCF